MRTQKTKTVNAESSPLIKENLPEGQSFNAGRRREVLQEFSLARTDDWRGAALARAIEPRIFFPARGRQKHRVKQAAPVICPARCFVERSVRLFHFKHAQETNHALGPFPGAARCEGMELNQRERETLPTADTHRSTQMKRVTRNRPRDQNPSAPSFAVVSRVLGVVTLSGHLRNL